MAIDDIVYESIRSGTGAVVIMAGSDSDRPHIDKIVKSLEKYSLPYEVRICSAHKQPEKLMEIINEYNSLEGLVVYVAVAGGTDALSGTVSYHANGLVISSPPDGTPTEPNMSCLTNPPGSSNVYCPRPENVVRAIVQVFSGDSAVLRNHLKLEREQKIKSLEKADSKLQEEYSKRMNKLFQ